MTIQTTSEIYLDNNATTQPLPEVIETVSVSYTHLTLPTILLV